VFCPHYFLGVDIVCNAQRSHVSSPSGGVNSVNSQKKIVATRCQILRLKCTKFDFGWGSASDPARGAYSAPPYPLAGFNGAYF